MSNDEQKIVEEVSAAYQGLEKESPPASLDDFILQAAKKDLKKPQTTNATFHYRRYSIAASICLCVLIGSIFLNNKPLTPTPNANKVSVQTSTQERNKAESSEAIAEGITEDIEARSASAEPSLESATFADDSVGSLSASDANGLQNNLLQAEVDNDADGAQELEEIVATGSRIIRRDQAAASPAIVLDYRSSVELWLQEIKSLLESDEAAAQEEMNLFTQAYPDINLDAALNELE